MAGSNRCKGDNRRREVDGGNESLDTIHVNQARGHVVSYCCSLWPETVMALKVDQYNLSITGLSLCMGI